MKILFFFCIRTIYVCENNKSPFCIETKVKIKYLNEADVQRLSIKNFV